MAKHVKRETTTPKPDGPLEPREIGERVAQQLKQLAREQLAQYANKPAADLGKLARALRTTRDQLEGNLSAPWIGRAADGLDRAVSVLEHDGADALEAIERLARKQPLLFAGGALAVGVGAGRFLKSTARSAASNEPHATPHARASRATPNRFQRENES